MITPEALVLLLTAVIVIILGTLSLLIFRHMTSDRAKAMNSFQLHHEKYQKDFKLMLIGAVFLSISYGTGLIGSLTSQNKLYAVSGIISIPYAVITCIVFYRWVKRFE